MEFIVASSNPNQKGGFVTKMVSKTIVEHPIFGKKEAKLTYYISAEKQIKLGTKIKESDLFPVYRIEEHEGVIPEGPEAGKVITLKWLHLNTKGTA